MFYDQFIKLCEERGLKPTPTVKKMGLSPGNMKRWESGAAVNSETLEKCAAFFGVPIDYFFEGEETYRNAEISDNAKSLFRISTRTSFRQILPYLSSKILEIPAYSCGFFPKIRQNYARKSAHAEILNRL